MDLTVQPGAAPRIMTGAQIRIVAICFLVAMVDGFDTLMLSFIAPLLAKTWQLPHGAMGKLFSVGYVGAVLGAFLIGPLADRLGRKRVLLAAIGWVALFTLLCASAGAPGELMLYRFMAGLGLGGAIPAITALTAENVPEARRSGMVTLMFLGFPLGAVVGGGVTSLLLGRFSWEVVFLLGGVAALLVLLPVWLGVPESRPAAAQDRTKGALLGSAAQQFHGGRRVAALLLWGSVFLLMVVTYFLVSWTPTVLTLAGMSPAKAALGGVALNLGGILGALGISAISARRGPFIPAAAALAIGGVMVWVAGQGIGSASGAMLSVFLVGLCVIGGQLGFPAMGARLFPAEVRGAGIGALMGVGRLGSIAGPLAGGALLAMHLPWSELYLIAAVPVLLAAAGVACAERARPHQSHQSHLDDAARSH